jgi:integrase
MLRTFLKWAEDRGYTTNENYKKFKASNEHVDIICLSEDELFRIYNADFSHNKKLDRVRDVFCFGCFTGQRFSDLANIKREDIKGFSWWIRTKKTRDIIEIPLNEFALEILNKYPEQFKPLPVMSNQKMNDYLKEMGKYLCIDEQITRVRYSGAKRIEVTEPKYNFISSHIARRTFVTLSLEKGMRPETVMTITGHKDFKTLQRYIRISSKVKNAEMNNIWKREALMKVV